MTKYRFELTDYRAINKANIVLDGLTILSGLNGSGKSTIAKCLQYIIDTLINQTRYEVGDQSNANIVATEKETRNWENFSDKIVSIADETIEDSLVQIQLWEDGVELLNPNEFKIPLMLNRVIYINTQELGNPFIRRSEQGTYRGLLKMLSDTSESPVGEASKSIAYLIKNLIGGDINVEKQDLGGKIERTEFKFVAKNGKSFNLKGVATGVISFSYILQLLQNGWLTDKAMLIIDEPESHLHPQWIVDYARILVLINKMVGTKILLSSHNPDMIAAIQTISESKGLKDITRFYLATLSPEAPDQNDFRDLGFNIEEIFDSFNIALSRIDSYNLPS